MIDSSKSRFLGLGIFFTLWLAYGACINSDNLIEFNLQQMGVEAIVERGHFYVEGSEVPELQPNLDVFEFNDHLYPAKQPGQFLYGALVYFFLHGLGITYAKNFLLTSALVTFFTASFVTALAGAMLFFFAGKLVPTSSVLWRLIVVLAFAIASTTIAYSGITHHDAIASGFLILGFYALFEVGHREQPKYTRGLTWLGGVLLGLSTTTSMLPFPMVIGSIFYFLSFKKWHLFSWLALGLIVGVAPLLAYDYVSFGNPLLLPNIAGDFSDTFFYLDLRNFQSKVIFYATSLAMYSPISLVGLGGLTFLPREFRREKIFIFALLGLLCFYLFNIETVGSCEYGPRYLLPAMPFFALGLVGSRYLRVSFLRRTFYVVLSFALGYSVVVNIVGAMYGAMYCWLDYFAFNYYLALIRKGKIWTFPLALWLGIPLVLCLIIVIFQIWYSRSHNTAVPQ